MDRQKMFTVLIAVIALAMAIYALVSVNQFQRDANAPAEPKALQRIQTVGSGITITQNRLGGAGAVELRRDNRIDLFGGLDDLVMIPVDYFDLSPIDEDAADKLTASLIVPAIVQPFRPFTVQWKVKGPSNALARVNSYQLNGFGSGPIFNLPAESSLTSEGLEAQGSVVTSMWQSGPVKLWARFGSGIRELEVTEVTMDNSACAEKEAALIFLTTLLRGAAADQFVDLVKERAGSDVNVTVLKDADAFASSDGFEFAIDLRLATSKATVDVKLEMQFMLVPRAGHLGSSFTSTGYRSVVMDPDLPWYDDLWHTLTLGEHNLNSYQTQFFVGLKELAEGFAVAVEENFILTGDNENDNIIGTAIDETNAEFVAMLCPAPNGLVAVSGIFPAETMKAKR